MERSLKKLLAVGVMGLCVACGSASPSGPSSSATTAPPTQTSSTFTLNGTVSLSTTGTGASTASVTILDGPNAGRTTQTDAAGAYSLTGLRSAGFNVSIVAPGFVTVTRGVNLASDTTLSVTLLSATAWTMSGLGPSVFNIPSYVTTVRIEAFPGAHCQTFNVRTGTELLWSVIIGPCRNGDPHQSFSAIFPIAPGTEITILEHTDVSWTFIEVR
jgi:hypothetical protein